ncbi:MAG: hypothetical protein LIO59_00830 [Oscillospiraceae bacterium]|nr:hypothetical protein [Oscillospiraceae bacterium]
MKKNKWFMVAAVAAAGVYGIVRGKGIFNKPRFRSQHDAVSRDVNQRYPGATYTPIEATENGWATVVIRAGQPKILLYVTQSDDGFYIFHEVSE